MEKGLDKPIGEIDNPTNERTKVHCLFEQSGTFKNEFKKLGYEAYDYDIQNEFGETDYIIDLFAEIRNGYEDKPSIFDNISKDDIVLAFFPCTRFEDQVLLAFRGDNYGNKSSDIEKLNRSMGLHDELHRNYILISELALIAIKRQIRLVIENPYSDQHYLKRYWCLTPSLIDKDRRDDGDYFRKPTQYYFLNFKPKQRFLLEAIPYNAIEAKMPIRLMSKDTVEKVGAKDRQTARSMIHPDYANRFIRKYLIDDPNT